MLYLVRNYLSEKAADLPGIHLLWQSWWGDTGDLVQLCSPSYSLGYHSIRSTFAANMLGRETVNTPLMLPAFCQHHISKDAGRWHHLQSYCFSLSWDRAVPGEHSEVTIKQVKYRACVFDRNNLNTSTNKIQCVVFWFCFLNCWDVWIHVRVSNTNFP